MPYAKIVFLEKKKDFAGYPGGAKGFFNSTIEEMIEYLMLWDSGEYMDIEENPPWLHGDHILIQGNRIMYYEPEMKYAGLTVKLSKDEVYKQNGIVPVEVLENPEKYGYRECPACGGSGYSFRGSKCPGCKGIGLTKERKGVKP